MRLCGFSTTHEETPTFLISILPERRTHSICPECFAEVERQAGEDAPIELADQTYVLGD